MKRLIQILSVLVALAAVGVGVAVSLDRRQDRVVSEVITREAPELGPGAHLLLPNLDGARVSVPDRPHDPEETRAEDRHERITRLRTFEVSTNSRGFRGPELSEAEGFRVVCLGDSVTFGWGVPYAQSYPALLAEELGVEVVNTGVPAMKPQSIAAFAEGALPALEPDLVLFTRRPHHGVPDPYRDYEQALSRVRRAAGGAPVAVILPPVSTFDVMGTREGARELREIRRIAGELPILELTEAFRAALPLPGVVMELDGDTQRVLELPGRRVLLEAPSPPRGLAPEVVALFEGDEGVAEPLFFDGGHPDAPGFRIFAAEVARFLREQGLVPRG